MKYYTRGVRRRGDTDQWEVRIMHKDPITQEEIFEYNTDRRLSFSSRKRNCRPNGKARSRLSCGFVLSRRK